MGDSEQESNGESTTDDNQSPVKQQIVDAAGQVFAEHGYDATSVRQICKAAKVNVASISYYFGGKKGLYREVLLGTHKRVIQSSPPSQPYEGMTGEAQVGQWIHWFVHHLLDTDNKPAWLPRLLMQELGKPTTVLSEVVSLSMQPVYTDLKRRLKALLGSEISEDKLNFYAHMVVAPCVYYVQGREIIERLEGPMSFTRKQLKDLSYSIQTYVLGGLKAFAQNHNNSQATAEST